MVKELTINWRQAEAGFADFCMDYFDENPIMENRMGFAGESNEVLDGVNSSILLFFERIVMTIFRYIFVKKITIKKAEESLQQKSNQLNRIFDTINSRAAHVLYVLVYDINTNKLTQKVGFT